MTGVVTLHGRIDTYNFSVGQPLRWVDNTLVRATRLWRFKEWLCGFFRPRFVVTALDAENGTITVGGEPRWWQRLGRRARRLVHA